MASEIIIRVPRRITADRIGLVIDNAITEFGLKVTMRGTLKSYPGSTHWHIKRGREIGTLEMTWWPQPRKLWIKIHPRRAAPWIDESAPRFAKCVHAAIRGKY